MSGSDDKGTGTDDKGTGKDDKGTAKPPKSEIREVVTEVLGELGFTRGRANDDDDDDDRGRSPKRTAGGRRAVDPDDIARQVEAAVERVTEKSAKAKAEQDREARLKALEEKTAKPERTPREFRKATRIMGWVTDDDH